jgi:D-tyrosyl-tRNA(Tyr) deacylase
MDPAYLIVAAGSDPVAAAVRERWGVPESTGGFVDGAPIRRLSPDALLLDRPGLHIHDERLDERLPGELRRAGITLVFPSIHRSAQSVRCMTVHPLGNPGTVAEVGGRPGSFSPTDPRRMVAALRRLHELADRSGLPATYEATHHGPELGLPAFFVEIGFGEEARPPASAVGVLAEVVPDLAPDETDRVALAVGGGHYAPHFTDLALKRRWAFGHILSRHSVAELNVASARGAWAATPGAEGIVFARAEDARSPVWDGTGPRLREQDAPVRTVAPTSGARSASGT